MMSARETGKGARVEHIIIMRAAVMAPMALMLATACNPNTAVDLPKDRLAVGTWGGDNAGVIADDGNAHVHIDCTFGDVPGIIPLDANGRFDVAGSYLLRAYPVAIGPTHPARFAGRVQGSSLTLTVTVTDTIEDRTTVLGPVSVAYGHEPQMPNCPICRTWPQRGSGNMSRRPGNRR